MYNFRRRIFEIIEDDVKDSLAHRIFEASIVALIVLNAICIVVESFKFGDYYFNAFEKFTVAVFTIEYLLRIWTADFKYRHIKPMKARVRFVFSFMGMVDILTILPFYLSFISLDGRMLRILRLVRLLRIAKLSRFLDSFMLIKSVIHQRINEILITVFIVFLMLVVSSTMMFEFENSAQPDKFPNILSAFWWAVATLTTIGYGDIYPITTEGKIFSAVISLIGIGMVALPTGIISSGFIEEYRNRGKQAAHKSSEPIKKVHGRNICPNCGCELEHEEH